MRFNCLAYILLLFTVACSLVTPVDIGNAHRIALPFIDEPVKSSPKNRSLIVSRPTVSETLDTYRIALAQNSQRIDYYRGMRWDDFLPVLVQESILHSITNAGLYKNVMSDESIALNSQILHIDINDFNAVYTPGSSVPVWVIRMQLTWRNTENLAQIRSVSITQRTPATSDSKEALETAIEKGFQNVLRRIVSAAPH